MIKGAGKSVVKNFSFEELDPSTEEWVARCVVRRLRDKFDLRLIQFQLGQVGILSRVLKVGEFFCVFLFLEVEDLDMCLSMYVDMFEHWFIDLKC